MKIKYPQHQRGATLIVCMIILIVITFLGVGSIQDTTMEEKMAGNMKNKNMAFQAGESALRSAENILNTTAILPDFDGTTLGYIDQIPGNTATPDSWTESQWTTSGAIYSNTSASLGVASPPRYVIEKLESIAAKPDKEAGQVMDTNEFYRITARAVGGTSTSVVIVQSIYKR
ncbi:MAG: PilX N-terminal domain-containing pilus assembly protein [Motiliproteus sp.]|nr:PilX N-terminal domain-containing pilus assembly protein [Motiliproteus sp.]MCW9052314.1 PilX N-terminal domain-containing pilus assembly protein [Motiliproteus sp.]